MTSSFQTHNKNGAKRKVKKTNKFAAQRNKAMRIFLVAKKQLISSLNQLGSEVSKKEGYIDTLENVIADTNVEITDLETERMITQQALTRINQVVGGEEAS